jgi:hypothetical protein
MSIQDFKGWWSKQINLPDGGKIVCFYFRNSCGQVSHHDVNHNIYRLNAAGEVLWQVQRDDSNHPPGWWELLNQHARERGQDGARERGQDGAREPFTYFMLKYPDGQTNCTQETGDPPNVAVWTPDCTIILLGSAYQRYILDPDSGIARNVTEWPVRQW